MIAPWHRARPDEAAEVATDDDEFLTVEMWPRDVFRPHYHEEFNWIVPMRPGRVVVRVEDREHTLDDNHWICIFPRTPHAVLHVSDHCEVLSLFLPTRAMELAYGAMRPSPPIGPRCIVGGAGTVAQGLALLWGELRFARRQHDAVDDALLPFVTGWIWRAYRPFFDEAETYGLRLRIKLGPLGDIAARFFDEHLADTPFPWESLALATQTSRRTLQRRFLEALGVTPAGALAAMRTERARELLRDPMRAIGDIALACGFASQSHFSTVFKVEHGVSPARFRAAVQQAR